MDGLIPCQQLFAARLIKVDVEGAEREVFEPLVDSLSNFSPTTEWLIELSPQYCPGGYSDTQWIFASFIQSGYRAYRMTNAYSIDTYLSDPQVSHLESLGSLPDSQVDVLFTRRAIDGMTISDRSIR